MVQKAEQHHKYTGGLLLLFTLLVLVGAVLFTIAQVRVTNIEEYKNGNAKLNSAKNNLVISYVLAYIAAGMGLVLSILYFGHVAWGIQTEWPHLIVFILLFALIIVSGIFAFIALSDISNASPSDNKGAPGWTWGGLGTLLAAIVVLIISGAWRAQYNSTKATMMSTAEPNQKTVTFTAPSEVNAEIPEISSPAYPAPIAPTIPVEMHSTSNVPLTTAVNYNEY
jgi:hypothetical protein